MKEDTVEESEKRFSSSELVKSASFDVCLVKKTCHEHGDDCPSENEREFESLEYEEDVYYSHLAETPSFDDIDELLSGSDEIIVHRWHSVNGDLEEILANDTDVLNIDDDAEFSINSKINNEKSKFVRVMFRVFSKPFYHTKILTINNYNRLIERLKGEDALHSGSLSPSADNAANELAGLSLEEQEQQKEEWRKELAQTEEDIQMFRNILASKVKTSQELKRKLGISVWKDITEDVNQGLRNVKESHVFQKTESVCKQAAGLTTSILGGFSTGLTSKLGQMRNSESFRSLEERVGSAYENVKTKVVPSRSNSTQSFDEALREAEASRRASGAASAATSPTIPEEKLLS